MYYIRPMSDLPTIQTKFWNFVIQKINPSSLRVMVMVTQYL